MVELLFADGGEYLPILIVGVNILNKQSQAMAN
jgi:hypothetical protein